MIKKLSMQRIVKCFVFTLTITLIINSCSEDNTENTNYFKDLNGFWIGKIAISQLGSCSLYGDSIENALWKININDKGVVDIIEYFYFDSLSTYYYIDSAKYHWTGTINKEFDFNLQKPGFANCFGEPREYFTQFKGTILTNNDEYKIKTDSDEEWCPTENCIFNISYELVRIDSLITNIKKYDESILISGLKSIKIYNYK